MRVLSGFLVVAFAAGAACAEPPALRWDIVSSNEFALKLGDRDVWRFHADPSKASKPYFDPVAVAGGPSLTWARPPDHPWHYGLWFSWKYINGVNYWEEDKGQSSGKTGWSVSKVETQPYGRARIELALDYCPAAGAEPVLREQRTISLSAPDAAGAYTVDWTQVFTAGSQSVALDRTPLPGEPGGQSWGGYAGLSIRFARAITNVETVASTVGRVPRDAAGRLDVTAAAAEQNGVIDGKPCGIAILAHPSNPRAPGDWYPIEGKSFTYLNAAFLLKSAYTLKSGETLTLRYRVCVHSGRWDAAALRQAVAQPEMQTFRVNLADKTHPVTHGMADFETFDEPWQHIGNRNPGRRVLATGIVAKENGGSGEPEPFAFVTELGKGRCFNLVLGHDAQALGNAGCRTLVLRGAEWAATGEVR
jgi:hypothetical protein